MSASGGSDRDARALRVLALVTLLVACLPAAGALSAPWIAEDAAILARVRADGPWADWTRSQFGLELVRFWRPLVSTSWALQEAWTGIAPLPLRLLNVSLHALAALLALACARRLGAAPLAAGLAGAWVALFPEQGGTSVWLAGRTDLLAAVFLLASLLVALGPRPLLSAPLAFLACASKEYGFLAPLWIALLARGRGEDARAALRRAAPAGVAMLVAFVWRRLALGGFAGGYPALLPGPLEGLLGAARGVALAAWPSLGLLVAMLVGARLLPGAGRARLERGGFLAGLACALLATGLLYPLLADGHLEPENRRLLYVPECALGLALAATVGRTAVGGGGRSLWLLALLVLVPRGALALHDARDWARAAEEGEAEVARVRALVAGAEPSEAPVVASDFPVSRHDAYCLGYGLAARFRAPFPQAPRPVWPWRLVGVHDAGRERAPLVEPRAPGVAWPMDDPARVPTLALLDAHGQPLARLALDERSFQAADDRSPRLRLAGGRPGDRLEALVVSELGYEPFPLPALPASGEGELSLMQLLAATNGVFSAGELLMQAADLGAQRAYLELRVLGEDGAVRAAGRWVELVWPPELLARALSAR